MKILFICPNIIRRITMSEEGLGNSQRETDGRKPKKRTPRNWRLTEIDNKAPDKCLFSHFGFQPIDRDFHFGELEKTLNFLIQMSSINNLWKLPVPHFQSTMIAWLVEYSKLASLNKLIVYRRSYEILWDRNYDLGKNRLEKQLDHVLPEGWPGTSRLEVLPKISNEFLRWIVTKNKLTNLITFTHQFFSHQLFTD